MAVSWEPYIWDAAHPADPHELELLEQQWGVRFPSGYRRLVVAHQGMSPEPSAFNVGSGRDVFCVLLTVSVDEVRDEYSLRHVYGIIEPHVPAGIFPFALTSGGEFLCFDYRASPEHPAVVLVSVDMLVHPIAGSFSDFMASLYDA
ncbi:SMI1/KNR4 family protein [Archangium violaceum]|uniref:SMI1/KNR4 family protein n=1 Tax=Archangium violaceum TaxID=83451 RepID=UPI00195107AB|nr:SMI1/KNR4 family protein [Archangium violaceum]QRO00666.1 SMI1/KNR4 family protein [Archangium violaceum]